MTQKNMLLSTEVSVGIGDVKHILGIAKNIYKNLEENGKNEEWIIHIIILLHIENNANVIAEIESYVNDPPYIHIHVIDLAGSPDSFDKITTLAKTIQSDTNLSSILAKTGISIDVSNVGFNYWCNYWCKKHKIPSFLPSKCVFATIEEHGGCKHLHTPAQNSFYWQLGFKDGFRYHPTSDNKKSKFAIASTIQNSIVRTAIIGDAKESKEDDQRLFIPAYIQSTTNPNIFESNNADNNAKVFALACALSPLAKSKTEVVIFLNKNLSLTEGEPQLLRKAGYKSFQCINLNGTTSSKISLAKKGKVLTIVSSQGQWLESGDHEKLWQCAHYIAGVSGDNSLEAALSSDLLPLCFLPHWKDSFYKEFISEVKKHNKSLGQLTELLHRDSLKKETSKRYQELAPMLTIENYDQWLTINNEWRNKYNFPQKVPEIVTSLLNAYYYLANPSFPTSCKLSKRQLRDLPSSGNISFVEQWQLAKNNLLFQGPIAAFKPLYCMLVACVMFYFMKTNFLDETKTNYRGIISVSACLLFAFMNLVPMLRCSVGDEKSQNAAHEESKRNVSSDKEVVVHIKSKLT